MVGGPTHKEVGGDELSQPARAAVGRGAGSPGAGRAGALAATKKGPGVAERPWGIWTSRYHTFVFIYALPILPCPA